MDFLQDWGHISGVAGMMMVVVLLVYRGIVSEKFLAKLTKKQSFALLLSISIIVFLLSCISIFAYYYNSQKQLSVFLTDIHGNAIENEDIRVNIPLGNRVLNSKPGRDGRISFSDIPSKYIGDTLVIGLASAKWELNCCKRIVFTGEPVTLTLNEKEKFHKFKLFVVDEAKGSPVDSAKVMVNLDSTFYTDIDGVINHNIKVNDLQILPIIVSKIGYKTYEMNYHLTGSPVKVKLIKIK